MDLLSDLLSTFKLRANVFLHSQFCGNWAVDTSGSKKATFHMLARGSAWLHLSDEPHPIFLNAQDLVVFPRDAEHTISKNEQPPAASLPRNQPADPMDERPSTSLICGYFEFEQHDWNPLLNALPEVVVIRAEEAANTALMDSLVRFIIFEAENNNLGESVVIDKLSEVLFIHIVRTYIHKQEDMTGYMASMGDRQISQALTEIHEQPGESWTVETLASKVGMSRSAFAEKFHRLVTLTPMQYLACWRMQCAHGLFVEQKLSVAQVAERYSYQTEASFSKAFKKHFGYGPGVARRLSAAAESGQS